MTKCRLLAEITQVMDDENRYAARLLQQGDMGRAKLALAAINEVEAALNAAALGDAATYAQRLEDDLRERRSEYRQLWDDEDGIGGSTFLRVLDLIETAD